MKFVLHHTLVRIGALLGLLAFAAAGAWAQLPQLITPLKDTPVQAKGLGVQSGALAVRFNAAEMRKLKLGDDVELALPNGTREVYVFELSQSHGGGIVSWVGQHKAFGNRHRAIVTTGPGGSFGRFSTPHGTYRLIPGSGGYDLLVDMNAEQMHLPLIDLRNDMVVAPPESKGRLSSGQASPFAAIRGLNTLAFAKVVPDTTIDIMFVYTRGLAQNLGATLMTRLQNLVLIANTAYVDSDIALQLRLVNATLVDYSDSNSNNTALYNITPACTSGCPAAFDPATFGAIESIRSAVGADVVAFMRNGGSLSGSGVAWVGSTSPSALRMYSVTTGCVRGCESVFVHEVGHNMGNKHDRATTAFQDGGVASPSIGAFPYSYGYAFCTSGTLTCNPNVPGGCTVQPECSTSGASTNNFADIMAYFQGTAVENLKFSNPNVTCQGPVGTPMPCGVGEAFGSSANTALSMSNNRAALSAVRTQTITSVPGALQLNSSAIGGVEGGSIVFNVSRVGGSAGTVSVAYATSNVTAIAGQDYTAQSGTLTWNNLDTVDKQVTIPILGDAASENAEIFTLALSNPMGATGVFLGYPSTATGFILGTWPPNNAMPSGFVTPDGSSGAWTVANDQSNDASFSLRSAAVLAATQGVYVNSDLTYAGTFVAGTVGFAHKVSAYPDYGVLEFMVDGVVVMTNSASSSAWQYYTTSVTAGTHTLKWRFKNRLNFECRFVSAPAAPDGANCADRAWIDSVTLPLPVVTASTAATDFNKDGKSDMLWRNSTTGQVFRILMNGLTSGAGALIYNEPNTAWRIIADADFNGDGVADLLWRNSTTGLVFTTTLNESGLVSGGAVVYIEPNTAWQIIHTPDFNGDGKADLLYWNSSTGQVYGILMDGFTAGTQGLIYAEPNTSWRIVAVGDFAGSGKRNQLLYRNSATGQVYLMTVAVSGGGFTQTGQMIYQEANTAWKIIATADFNGDGKSDILWRNDTDGRIFMMHMNGAGIAAAALVYQEANLAWKVVAVGDYNGDGKADMLWRNESTGQVFAMLMNGFALSSANLVYQEPNTAWKILGPLEYAQ